MPPVGVREEREGKKKEKELSLNYSLNLPLSPVVGSR